MLVPVLFFVPWLDALTCPTTAPAAATTAAAGPDALAAAPLAEAPIDPPALADAEPCCMPACAALAAEWTDACGARALATAAEPPCSRRCANIGENAVTPINPTPPSMCSRTVPVLPASPRTATPIANKDVTKKGVTRHTPSNSPTLRPSFGENTSVRGKK